MSEKETNVDCMKYRKSTHLAGIDVENFVHTKGSCYVTIKEAYYQCGVDVSGNKTDGYFLEFVENFKPMVVNSTNRKIISAICKEKKNLSNVDSRNLKNWQGLVIDLYFDESITMMKKVVGGIRVKDTSMDFSNMLTEISTMLSDKQITLTETERTHLNRVVEEKEQNSYAKAIKFLKSKKQIADGNN